MNKLMNKIKVFFKGLFPNIGKEVKPVVIEKHEPRKRIVKKVKNGTQTIKGKGKKK